MKNITLPNGGTPATYVQLIEEKDQITLVDKTSHTDRLPRIMKLSRELPTGSSTVLRTFTQISEGVVTNGGTVDESVARLNFGLRGSIPKGADAADVDAAFVRFQEMVADATVTDLIRAGFFLES